MYSNRKNNYAISTNELATSLTSSASALQLAGNSLEQSVALLTGGNTILQDPDVVSTSLKVISLRIRGVTSELQEMGESVDDVVNTSKLQAQIKALTGVDIVGADGAFRSTYDILVDIGKVYNELDSMSQSGVLELLAGKQRANALGAILTQIDTVEDAYTSALESDGSATKELEKYLDSIQGKIDQFTNAVQSMWSNTLNSDVVKGFVELGTELIKILDAIGPLNVAFVGMITFLEKNYSIFSNLFKPAGDNAEQLRKQLKQAKKDLEKAEAADIKRHTNKTFETKENAKKRVSDLEEKVKPYDDVDNLRKQREDLLKRQANAQVRMDIPETTEEAKKDLVEINAQLKQTNKELSEAEAKLSEIDKDFKPTDITDVVDDASDAFDPKKAKNSITGKKRARTRRANKLQAEGKSFAEIEADPKIQQYTKEIKEGQRALDEYNASVKLTDASLKQKNTTTMQAAAAERAKSGAEAVDANATNAGTAADIAADVAQKKKTASTWADVWAEITKEGATGASVVATLSQVVATKLANSALVQKGATEKGVQATELATLGVTELLTYGFYGLVASIKTAIGAMWTLMTTTPLGPILLVVAAVVAAVAAFSHFHKTTEELQEELDGFKSELSDIRSELDSVNSELETVNESIAELLAKDSLTFAEKEELERLQDVSAELERQKELLEDEEEYKSGLVGRQAAKVVDSAKDDKVNRKIEDYREIKEKRDNASSLKEREKYQEKLDKKSEEIDEYIDTIAEALDGVEYGDSEESDKALDYLAQLQYSYGVARGSAGVKTNAIKTVFKKSEFESMSKAINYYVDALKDGDESAKSSIEEIINNNEDLVSSLDAFGLDAQDAIDYWTQLGENARFDTLEGKTEEIKRATEKLPDAFNNIGQFMDGDEVDKTAIAEYFKGTSDKTREEIAQLIQDINDGNIDVENALKKFDLFGVQSVLEIEITEVKTNFKDVFTDLEDADGLIDTFQELADAIESTSKAMDALNAAQAEMDYSGRVSIETALKLMESTDDYSKVLTISEGKLVLAENAEENLIDARLEGMKASALKALEEAKAARESAVSARSTAQSALTEYNSAIETEMAAAVTATAWDKVLAAAAGLWAGIKSLFTGESWTEAYDRAYQETLDSLGGDRVAKVEAKYTTAEEQAKKKQLEKDIENADAAIEEQDKEIEKLQGNYDLVSGLNKDNIGNVFKSDGLDDPEDVIKNGWESLISEYENKLALITNERDLIQAEIDNAEAQGGKASAQYYEDLIRNSNEEQDLLEKKLVALQEYLDANKDSIDQDTWTEYNNEINETAVAIKECTKNTLEWKKALREIDIHYFDQATDELSRLGEELEFVNSLLEDEDVADENGNWSSAGLTRLAMYTNQLELAAADAARYGERIDELNEQRASGELSEEQYQEALSEAISEQQNAIQSYEDAKDSIVELNEARIDAIKDGIEKEIEAFKDLTDAKKKELEAERD